MDTHPAWRHWYHLILTPYGQWLPGDPRGWRERHHRKHVPGDYKHPPPPSTYTTARLAHSQHLLRQDPILFPKPQRPLIGQLILQSLQIQQLSCLTLSVGERHIHSLVQCLQNNPRIIIGKCKKNVWANAQLSEDQKRIWAKRCGDEPIYDRTHALRVFRYILNHAKEGAWVWSFKKSPFSFGD